MILVELEWFNKTATRLPESIWIEFILYWSIKNSGLWSETNACCRSNGIRFYDEISERALFNFYSYDAPVVSIGSPEYLLNFDNSMPDCQRNKNGLFINLHNNL